MAFDSGVSSYCWNSATVRNPFPIDERGVIYSACKYCRFFRNSYAICSLTDERVPFPEKYVGAQCPLEPEEVPADENKKNKKDGGF